VADRHSIRLRGATIADYLRHFRATADPGELAAFGG
jgi:hypothetical protein